MGVLYNEKGSALVVALFAVVILSLIGTGFISASFREYKISKYEEESVMSQYIAEGGIQKALMSLKEHPNWKSDPFWDDILNNEQPLGDGKYLLSFNTLGGNVLEITSTGKAGTGQKTLKVKVKINRINKLFKNSLVFSSKSIDLHGNIEVWGNLYSNLNMKGNVIIHGDVTCFGDTVFSRNETIDGNYYSGGDIQMSGNSMVKGNLLGMGDLTMSDNSRILGNVQINGELNMSGNSEIMGEKIFGGVGKREAIEVPALTNGLIESYRQSAIDDGSYYESGPLPGNISGTTFLETDLNISGNTEITGSGVLFVNGDIDLRGNSNITSREGELLLIIANGDIKLSGNKVITAAFFVPKNDFKVSGNTTIYGSVVAKNIAGKGNLEIHYLDDLQDRLPQNSPGATDIDLDIESWSY
ncbi:MAG: hypothetical protein PWP21_1116 [Thermosediminibacterales bacterium]|nr:hypothetical protein [Thermosediminibacterales bacterium]